MLLAILSDIHGNLAALTRVLERARSEGADILGCLGDIVGYGPFPNECVELVHEHCSLTVRGNHDAGAVGDLPPEDFNKDGEIAIKWTCSQLSTCNAERLKALPMTVDSHGITCVHSSPFNPHSWTYVATWQHAAEVFPHFSTPLCCIGHTHIPAIVAENGVVNSYQRNQRHLINVGSVGQPRDGDCRASFALIDTDRNSAQIIRVEYDVKATMKAIRDAGLPEFLARRLEYGI